MHLFLQEGYGKDEVRLFYVNAPRSEQDSYGSTAKTYAGAFQMSHASCHSGQFRAPLHLIICERDSELQALQTRWLNQVKIT